MGLKGATVSNIINYKRRVILRVSEEPEKWRVFFEGEEFNFPSLDKAMAWVDEIAKSTSTGYNNFLTC